MKNIECLFKTSRLVSTWLHHKASRCIVEIGLVVLVYNPIFASDPTTPEHASSQSSLSAEEAVLKSHEFVSEARSFKIVQTKVDKMTLMVAGKPTGFPMVQTNLSTISVMNGQPTVVELDTKDQTGKKLAAIRRGRSVVIKVGSQPWQLPSGPYAQLKQALADPYACPLPEPGKSGPRWCYAGTGMEQCETCDIVESVGDSVLAYVKKRVNEGLSQGFSDPRSRPEIQVESYVSRHWIGRRTGKRLRVEQSGRMQMTMRQPGAGEMHVQMDTMSSSVYLDYDAARVSIPSAADALLSQQSEALNEK